MLKLDFETYSDVDIKKVGAYVYASHPSTKILCLGYKEDRNPAAIWLPNTSYLSSSMSHASFYAHNAMFDYMIWLHCGEKAGLPPCPPLDQWIDTQALCARYTLPLSLEKAGAVLGLPIQKDKRGAQLIKLCCTPKGDPTEQDFLDLYEYCRQDVETLHELVEHLPCDHLTAQEYEVWVLTQKMNLQGAPIDKEAVEAILDYITRYQKEKVKVLPELTDGAVITPGQVARIKNFCAEKGVNLPNLQAETVTEALKGALPNDVRTLLKLRQELGKTSTAKYVKVKDQLCEDNTIKGNLEYYGAATGRWAGRGFQYHNLPRASVENPDEIIETFVSNDAIDNPVGIASALIRPMICAPPGHKLIVSDYSSIENRMLAWLVDDEPTLELFRKGQDQYKDMASAMYHVPYDQVTKEQRQVGKAAVLGCGYGMGAKRFKESAETYNVFMTENEAQFTVNAYRRKYYKVKDAWYALATAAKAAVTAPGRSYSSHKCEFKVLRDKVGTSWLRLMLPSGRALLYNSPTLQPGQWGPEITHMGINSYSGKWSRLKLIPGRITENIVQALARDILAHGKLNIQFFLPYVKLFLSVHDEAGGLIPEDRASDIALEAFNFYLCKKPDWAEGLPLEAEGYIAKRYKKG